MDTLRFRMYNVPVQSSTNHYCLQRFGNKRIYLFLKFHLWHPSSWIILSVYGIHFIYFLVFIIFIFYNFHFVKFNLFYFPFYVVYFSRVKNIRLIYEYIFQFQEKQNTTKAFRKNIQYRAMSYVTICKMAALYVCHIAKEQSSTSVLVLCK